MDEPISQQPPVDPSTPSNDSVESLSSEAKCEEYLAGWKRAQADYANLKKDFEKERRDISRYANERMLMELFPAIEQFELAMSFMPNLEEIPSESRKGVESWIRGVRQVYETWRKTCTELGLIPITPATGDVCDFIRHEAVGREPSSEVPADTILRVAQVGWEYQGKILRPAKVIVASS